MVRLAGGLIPLRRCAAQAPGAQPACELRDRGGGSGGGCAAQAAGQLAAAPTPPAPAGRDQPTLWPGAVRLCPAAHLLAI